MVQFSSENHNIRKNASALSSQSKILEALENGPGRMRQEPV